jgi:hypothetical protein
MLLLPITVGVALLSLGSTAGAYTGTDGIGIFFDMTGTQTCVTGVQPYTSVSAYVCALNVSEPSGVAAWEGHTVVEGPLLNTSYTLAGTGPVNVATPPDFLVGLNVPTPYAPVILLLTIQVFYQGPGPIKFGLGPHLPVSSFPNYPGPGYARGDDVSVLKRLTEISNVPIPGQENFFYLAFINDDADCPVTATESSTWGGVKDLYK